MNLSELGFHKCAGAQKDYYAAFKKPMLNFMNTRNMEEFNRNMYDAASNSYAHLDTVIANGKSGRGAFSTVSGKEPNKIMGRTQGQLLRQLSEQDAKQELKRHLVKPARSTDPRHGAEQSQHSWTHLRGINPDAASKSGDRRYKRGF